MIPPSEWKECPGCPGWNGIMESLYDAIRFVLGQDPTEELITVSDIKEKFGGLRFYYTAREDFDDGIVGAVAVAENMSEITCQNCGNKGNRRNIRGWIYTLCQLCTEKEESRW